MLVKIGGGAKQFWIRANGSKLDYHWEEPFQITANLDKSLSQLKEFAGEVSMNRVLHE